MVEVALVLPLFLLLVFGIIEFSYATAQNNEVRHVTRDATRELGVNPTADAMALVCDNFDIIDPASVEVRLTAPGAAAGTTGELAVAATYQTLTGFLDPLFAGLILETTHRFVVEQPFGGGAPSWAPGFGDTSCP